MTSNLSEIVLAKRSPWMQAVIGIVCTASATLLRMPLTPWVGSRTPWLTYLLSVLVASLAGGPLAAFVAVAGALVAGLALFVDPMRHVLPVAGADEVGTLAFAVVATCIAVLGVRFRSLLRESDRRASALAREVRQREEAERLLRASSDDLAAENAALERLRDVGQRCATGTPDECLREVLATAMWMTRAPKGTVQRRDARSGALTLVAHQGFPPRFVEHFERVGSREASVCSAALEIAQRVIVEDVQASPLLAGGSSRETLLEAGVRAVASTPLVSSRHEVLGMVSVHFERPHRPSERELRLLDLLARQAGDYLERVRGEEQRAELLRAAESARALAERANREKDEFLAMLGHELRNPLAAIRNAVSVAAVGADHRDEALAIAKRQGEQLGRLIDDLLDVARITHGRITIHREPLRMQALVQHVVEATRPLYEPRGHDVRVELPGEPLYVAGDETRLEQVLQNLISNACKFTEPGGTIAISVAAQGGDVLVRVRDSGIGIAPEALPRVFELFAQVDSSLHRSRGGLGVGLAIARRIVQLHGGTLEAASAGAGRGAEFVVRLRQCAAPVRDEHAGGVAPAGERVARILLVEDNPDVARTLRLVLEARGHEITTVSDGLAALDAARREAPDVMLVDIGLPGLDGYEIARRARSDPALQGVFLVALTGYGSEEDRRASRAAGFDHHLVKPTALAEIDSILEQATVRATGERARRDGKVVELKGVEPSTS